MENPLDYKRAYASQKAGAARRGIEWQLTFEQWLDWWGDDIARRGTGSGQLQMQRFADSGPYALGNIRKGVPKNNRETASAVMRNKRSAKAAADHQARLDAMMWLPSAPDQDDFYYSGEEETANKYAARVNTTFPRTHQLARIL